MILGCFLQGIAELQGDHPDSGGNVACVNGADSAVCWQLLQNRKKTFLKRWSGGKRKAGV